MKLSSTAKSLTSGVSLLFFCAVTLPLLPRTACADDRAAAERILVAYEQTVSKVSSFHIESVTKEWDKAALQGDPDKLRDNFSQMQESTIFHDDFRWKINLVDRRSPQASDRVQFARRSGVEYRFDEFLGANQGLHVQWASRDTNEPPTFDHLAVRLMGVPNGDEHRRYLNWADLLFGRMPCDAQLAVWKVMRDTEMLELLPDMENIATHKTYVVKSRGQYGSHTLWLDPDFGFLPRQIVIHKQGGHLFNEIQLGVEQSPSARLSAAARARIHARGLMQPNYTITESENRIENIRIEERKGRFLVTAFDHVQEQTVKTGERTDKQKNRTEFRIQAFDLEPESWPVNAFHNSVKIPNGTRVSSPQPAQSYAWMNGKVE